MLLFYAPEIEKTLQLPREEAQHCFKVLRKKNSEEITVIDGKGTFFFCIIRNNDIKKHKLEIIRKQRENRNDYQRKGYLHIAIAPTKNIDRIEWFVEKAVEIGIDEISFVRCDRSERKSIKYERIERKAISAIKQSLKATLPRINELVTLDEFLLNIGNDTKLIAHLNEESIGLQEASANQDTCILIGPEGDFSQEEVSRCLEAGFRSVSLGKSRLRTETAGVVACTLLNF